MVPLRPIDRRGAEDIGQPAIRSRRSGLDAGASMSGLRIRGPNLWPVRLRSADATRRRVPGESSQKSAASTSRPCRRSSSQRSSNSPSRSSFGSVDIGVKLLGECDQMGSWPPRRSLRSDPRRQPSAVDGPLGDAQDSRRLGLGQPLIPQQVEQLAVRLAQRLDGAMELAPGRQTARVVGRVRHRQASAGSAEPSRPARVEWCAPSPCGPE